MSDPDFDELSEQLWNAAMRLRVFLWRTQGSGAEVPIDAVFDYCRAQVARADAAILKGSRANAKPESERVVPLDRERQLRGIPVSAWLSGGGEELSITTTSSPWDVERIKRLAIALGREGIPLTLAETTRHMMERGLVELEHDAEAKAKRARNE